MNSQQMIEEIDRIARLCEAKDADNKKLRGILSLKETLIENAELMLSEAQAQMVMQAKTMKELHSLANSKIPDYAEYRVFDDVMDMFSATSETVAAWRAKETEPLRREVAMLRDALSELKSESWLVPVQQLMYRGNTVVRKANVAINDTQATALAYEREVKAKAKLEFAQWLCTQTCVQTAAMQYVASAANKGE